MRRSLRFLSIVGALLPLAVAHAQDTETKPEYRGSAIPVELTEPEYPGHRVRSGQEGWVRMHFVVTADGLAVDPVIIDSSGGVAFEEEALSKIGEWRFEAPEPGTELPDNVIDIRFEIERGRDAATSNFLRRYRSIMTHVYDERYAEARTRIDSARERGGWNLYESAMLWLMVGRIEGAEGKPAGKLEAYSRAVRMSDDRLLKKAGLREALEKIFALEDQLGQYAHALSTYDRIAALDDKRSDDDGLRQRAAEIAAAMAAEGTLTAMATLYNPCDCDAGNPVWQYRPMRRTFSFARLGGNALRFEARCDSGRISGDVVEGKSWTLAPEWGDCRLFVFGEDGASFDFLGHLDDHEGVNGDAGRNDVLDSGN